MNAIILCGGLSTRLGDITKRIPKVLLEIGDKTVLDWQLLQLKRLGIRRVVMAAGHLSEVLHEQAGDMRHGIELLYAIEPQKLGTGGAIKHALQYVAEPTEPTIILNGDILSTIDLADMASFLKADSDGIILGTRVEDASSLGTLECGADYQLEAFKEKQGIPEPAIINGGIYLFTPDAQKYFPEKTVFSMEYDVFPHMKNLYVYQSDKPWIDVGVPERLDWARKHWEQFII